MLPTSVHHCCLRSVLTYAGKVPEALGNLHRLRVLDLGSNELGGERALAHKRKRLGLMHSDAWYSCGSLGMVQICLTLNGGACKHFPILFRNESRAMHLRCWLLLLPTADCLDYGWATCVLAPCDNRPSPTLAIIASESSTVVFPWFLRWTRVTCTKGLGLSQN